MLIPQRGGQERLLEELDLTQWNSLGVSGPYVAWAPDSKWLVLPSAEPGKEALGLLLVSVETLEKRRLTTPPAGFFDCIPAFSPDGETLAFTRCSTGKSGICFLHLSEDYEPQGKPQRAVTSEERFGFGPAWTQDGRDIVYCGGFGLMPAVGSKGLWRMTAWMSGKPVGLSFATDASSPPAVSRQGNRLAYAVERIDVDIYRIDLGEPGRNPGVPSKFISSTRNEWGPTYSPDGKKIAFTSDRSGFWETWVCDRDGSNAIQLTSLRGEDADGSAWSPDGRSIAFGSVVGGERYVCVTNAHGGAPRRLVTVPAVYWSWPSWSRDGQSIYFRSQRSGMSQIWKVPAAGGDAVQITPNGEQRDVPHESPDGKFLYFLKQETSGRYGVWRIPASGGEETKMADWSGYTIGEHGIYFVKQTDKPGCRDLSFYDSPTGKTRKIMTIENPKAFLFGISPDGRTILYHQFDERGSDLMLVENFR
jgi:Tol biopolymer transport system component